MTERRFPTVGWDQIKGGGLTRGVKRLMKEANVGQGNLSSNNTECDTREVEFLGFRSKTKLLP